MFTIAETSAFFFFFLEGGGGVAGPLGPFYFRAEQPLPPPAKEVANAKFF